VISRPRLLLLDEPFAGLDLIAGYRVCEVLREQRSRYGVTILFTTRDALQAENLADRVARLSDGRLLSIDATQAAYPVEIDCAPVMFDAANG
jgi:ABC-type multidrug transport system ATPase subunit